MPDGPRYEDDFYAWTQHQAKVVRTMPVFDDRFDREHVAEEIEDLGKSERDAIRGQIRRIIEHFLKLAYSPARAPRFDDNPADPKSDLIGVPKFKETKGREKLTVAGKTFDCEWTEVTVEGGFVTKTWTCNDVPGLAEASFFEGSAIWDLINRTAASKTARTAFDRSFQAAAGEGPGPWTGAAWEAVKVLEGK